MSELQQESRKTPPRQEQRVAVWDPAIRIGHWALVIAFAVAYLSTEEEGGNGPNLLHVWGGYAVGAIVVLRVLWGFVGPSHARFSDFVCGPATAFRYLVALLRRQAARYLGHSPAGGLMVIALLASLTATVGTGLAAYGDLGKGPLARVDQSMASHAVAVRTHADEAANGAAGNGMSAAEERESLLGEVHSTLANITLALVVLHVVGVVLASYAHRENLAAAMITGEKRIGD